MELLYVKDKGIEEIVNNNYDLVIFSCGYEQRSTSLSKILNKNNTKGCLVLLFEEDQTMGNRLDNQHYFNSFSNHKIEMRFDDEMPIYVFLNSFFSEHKTKRAKILVDYSSMSRLWYISVLNWINYCSLESVNIDFVYTVGEYKNLLNPLVISEIHAIPGHEGVTTHSKTISVFGLGFDSLTTLCVLDKLEPSKVHSFIAIPVHKEYENKAEEYNKDFIENYSEPVQYYPLTSIEKTYRLMSELIYPYKDEYNISFIPMGPKPHVLATALLSIKYPEIINLYVKGKRRMPPNVVSNETYICTRVIFKDHI